MKHKLLTSHDISAFIEEVHIQYGGMSIRKLLTNLGILNTYIWRMSVNWGAVGKVDGSKRQWEIISTEKLNEMVAACNAGLGECQNPVLWIEKYLSRFWPGTFRTQETICKYRFMMRDLGLFDYVQPVGASVDGVAVVVPTPHYKVDFIKMLFMYRTLDAIARHKIAQKYKKRIESGELNKEGQVLSVADFLPKHQGHLPSLIFDSLFMGAISWSGVVATEDVVLEVEAPEPEKIEQPEVNCLPKLQWQPYFKIQQKAFNALVNKARRSFWNTKHAVDDVCDRIQEELENTSNCVQSKLSIGTPISVNPHIPIEPDFLSEDIWDSILDSVDDFMQNHMYGGMDNPIAELF